MRPILFLMACAASQRSNARWALSQNSGVFPNRRARRSAISGLSARRSRSDRKGLAAGTPTRGIPGRRQAHCVACRPETMWSGSLGRLYEIADTQRGTLHSFPLRITGKRHNPILPTGVAMDTQKAVRKNAALKKGAQLPFHEPGNVAIPMILPFQKGLKLRRDHTIKNAIFRIVRGIYRCGFANFQFLSGRTVIEAFASSLFREKRVGTEANHGIAQSSAAHRPQNI